MSRASETVVTARIGADGLAQAGAVTVINSEELPALLEYTATIGRQAEAALLSYLLKRALRGDEIVLYLPVDELRAMDEAHEGTILLDAEMNRYAGGILLSRLASGEWIVSSHT